MEPGACTHTQGCRYETRGRPHSGVYAKIKGLCTGVTVGIRNLFAHRGVSRQRSERTYRDVDVDQGPAPHPGELTGIRDVGIQFLCRTL